MRFSLFSLFIAGSSLLAYPTTAVRLSLESESQMLGALAGAMGGGAAGGGGGDSGGTAQNAPSINIIDNARIMMMPGCVPGMGQMGGMMAQSDAQSENESEDVACD